MQRERLHLKSIFNDYVEFIFFLQSKNLNILTNLPGVGNIPRWVLGLGLPADVASTSEASGMRSLMALFYEFVTQEKMSAFTDFLALAEVSILIVQCSCILITKNID